MASRKNFRERIALRREQADTRQKARNHRGDAGQLAKLIAVGCGHCKEAKRLALKAVK